MSSEFPLSPFKAPAPPEKAPKKSKLKVPGMVKALGLAAGLHAAAYAAPDVAERVEQYQEEARQEENRERIERDRTEAVRRALAEIEAGDLHFWEFIRDTDRADMEAAEMPVPSAKEIERNFNDVAERLLEQQQGYFEVHNAEDRAYLLESLRIAFEGYYYTAGTGEADIQTFFHERGGPCGMISLAVASTLDRAGYEGIGLRYYPPDETGYGHIAPSLTFTDDRGVVSEIDLVGGGAVVPGGVTLPLEEVVREYAIQHDLLPREGAAPSETVCFGGASESATAPAGGGGPRGWSLSVPMPPETRPFGGDAPFYSPEIFGAYHTDEEGHVVEEAATGEGGIEGLSEDTSEFMHSFTANRFINRHFERLLTSGRESGHPGEWEFTTRAGLNDEEWTELSNSITWAERQLQEFRPGVVRLLDLGQVVGLYRLASMESSSLMRRQAREFAEEKIALYLTEAETIMAEHMNDREFFMDATVLTGESVGCSLSVLGERGNEMLVNYYDFLPPQPGLIRMWQANEDALTYMFLAPENRDAALERIERIPISQQLYLCQRLADIEFSAERNMRAPADAAILMGADEFSRNYRAYQALFGRRVLDERLAGGHFEAIAEHQYAERFTPDPEIRINHLSELMDEIHQYSQTHGLDQAWEEQATLFGVVTVVDSIRHFESGHSRLSGPSFWLERRDLLDEALQWMRGHPSPVLASEAAELDRFLRLSRQIDGP